nr:MAG TPA: hypothetical protein [Caudoviricetes sp.]
MQYNIPPITRNTLTRQINAVSLQGNKKRNRQDNYNLICFLS